MNNTTKMAWTVVGGTALISLFGVVAIPALAGIAGIAALNERNRNKHSVPILAAIKGSPDGVSGAHLFSLFQGTVTLADFRMIIGALLADHKVTADEYDILRAVKEVTLTSNGGQHGTHGN